MWHLGGLLAANAPAGPDGSLIVVIGGICTAVIGGLTLILVEVVKGRNSRAQVAANPGPSDSRLPERVAVLEDWRQTVAKADDLHDRTVYQLVDDVGDLVRWMDREHPDWRP